MELGNIQQERNQIVLVKNKAEQEGVVPIGATKVGGAPDIPTGFEFPRVKASEYPEDMDEAQDTYLRFIAQYNCTELSKLDKEGLLPKAGLISIFFDLLNMPNGYEPSHQRGVKVFYFPDIERLHRATPDELPNIQLVDEDDEGETAFSKITTEYTFKARTQTSYFQPDQYGVEDETSEDREWNPEWDDEELLDAMFRLLGWESSVQLSPKLGCSATSQGFSTGDYEEDEDIEDKTPLDEIANGWQLLGHIELGAFFKDEEYISYATDLYIEIPTADLLSRNFDNVRAVTQYT